MPNPVRTRFAAVLVAVHFCASSCGVPPEESDVLRVGIDRGPATWNRLLAADLTTHVVTSALHAPLIRLNLATQEMEPALASSWGFEDDGRSLVFRLREGLRFSDGAPFSSRDVVFTFDALSAASVASPLADTARIDGEPLRAEALDELTVRFRLPRRTASVERVFDSIGILPAHRLEASLARGALAEDSGLGAPLSDVVGLGPFRLEAHEPSERIVLERNPHYFGAEEGRPYLDRLVFEVVPGEPARVLRLRSGELDLVPSLGPDAFRELSREAPQDLAVRDLGPGMVSERLWFNLNPESPVGEAEKRWFGERRFREAVSLAIDREGLARVVYDGLATPALGPVSPANHFWRNEALAPLKTDRERARSLLEEAGFRLRAEALVDPEGEPVRFTLVTNAGNPLRERTAAFVQEDLARIGVAVDLASLEGGDLIGRITRTFDYEACLLGFTQTDPDPSAEMALWPSNAPLHLWHPGQEAPATEWEARVDALMSAQMGEVSRERRREAYFEVQRILAEQMPIVDLVVPHALFAHHVGVSGLVPTPFGPILWNVDSVSIEAR